MNSWLNLLWRSDGVFMLKNVLGITFMRKWRAIDMFGGLGKRFHKKNWKRNVFHDFAVNLMFQRGMGQGYSDWGKKFRKSAISRWQVRERKCYLFGSSCSKETRECAFESVRKIFSKIFGHDWPNLKGLQFLQLLRKDEPRNVRAVCSS